MKGLTSNKLKIIAIILMVLDHIGYYFVSYISSTAFDVLRFFGRMAMPVFAFLIVQGFFHTKDLKKYVLKLFVVATIFQALLFMLGIINNVYVKNYYIVINTYLNILYSFVICLLILAIFDNKIYVKNKAINYAIKTILTAILLGIYWFIDIELGYRVPCTVIGIYIAEKLSKLNKIDFEEYVIVVFATLVIALFTDYENLLFNLPSIISVILLASYNGQRGTKNNVLKNLFYIFYPLHHVVLYAAALLITHKVR